MKIFKEKQYTLQDGHYTGPKDEVPSGLKMIAGATAAGWALGKAADAVLDDPRKPVLGGDDPSSWSGRGTATGLVAGVVSKLILNTMHNPLDSIKFSELDRCIRREFGMYQSLGVTVGDSRENRERMKESFVINSKNLTDFKINVSVAKGRLVMYTLGLSQVQESELSETLDYYCKKYYGMKYTSTPLSNKRGSGSWAIDITFTNHQIASNFLVELGQVLMVKINILNNDISGEISEILEKGFSLATPALDKYELTQFFGKGALKLMVAGRQGMPLTVVKMIIDGLERLKTHERAAVGLKNPRENYGNRYLEEVMSDIDPTGLKYTVGTKAPDRSNMYLCSGTLLLGVPAVDSRSIEKIKELVKMNSQTPGVTLYTYYMKTPADLKIILEKIVGLGIKPNIYVP